MKDIKQPSIGDLIERVRSEFLEMPGLQLTCAQASRLWAVDPETCQRLLTVLLAVRFLRYSRDGRYSRAES